MNKLDPPPTRDSPGEAGEGWWTRGGVPALVGAGLVIAIIGAFIGRFTAPAPTATDQPQQARRPIVQIVRSQGPLPSLADTIDRLCPSIGAIVEKGATPSPPKTSTATSRKSKSPPLTQAVAFAVSADGWLVTSSKVPDDRLEVVFGDGTRAAITEVRIDPVSGIALAKSDVAGLTGLTLDDQGFARVGDFGFTLQTPTGAGCTADLSMIGGDFLTDATGHMTYVRLQSGAEAIPPGDAFFGGDGRVIAIASPAGASSDTLIPAPVAATIIDELIRGHASPTTEFGFRATDFTQGLSARVGDTRSRGAGVALVKPKSAADKAGLNAGDVIVSVNGSPVSSASELGRDLDGIEKSAELDVIRGDKRLTLQLTRRKS